MNTINGLSPTTIGLNWVDFTGSNAYANLPSQAYQVASGSATTSQFDSHFQSSNNGILLSRLYYDQLLFLNSSSSTTTTYNSTSINNDDSNAFTITAGSSASQPLNLNCSQLIINGVPYTPTTPIPLRWGYYNNVGQGFSCGGGSYTNVGIGSSPIQYLSGMSPYGSYTIAIQFSCWVDNAEPSSSCYISYNNINGSFTGLYDTGTPCPNTIASGVFPYGDSTQFTIQDTIIFVAGASGELALDLYFGTNTGWSGNYKWSLSAQIITP